MYGFIRAALDYSFEDRKDVYQQALCETLKVLDLPRVINGTHIADLTEAERKELTQYAVSKLPHKRKIIFPQEIPLRKHNLLLLVEENGNDVSFCSEKAIEHILDEKQTHIGLDHKEYKDTLNYQHGMSLIEIVCYKGKLDSETGLLLPETFSKNTIKMPKKETGISDFKLAHWE
ncbi:MAG: hypothetical protein ACMXYK_02755 [Candidatus Woesearchaeota archaeon]